MNNELIKIENETEELEFKIPVDELFTKFNEHLSIENNSRILFSGKFGIGKTYFLNEFFKDEKYKNEYEIFHLYPVNYQISSNEDIIELLKYDILVELFNRDEDGFFKEDENVKLTKSLITWSKDNSLDIVKNAISYIPKIGKPLNETIGLLTKFVNFHEESKNKDLKVIENFLQDSNIVETDILSEILKNKINEQKSDKKSILVLDDLDRIDPEHIFRILNVFSAHFNSDNEELPNKFGFDKIILVGDYSNLKSIFHHKYGETTDESGYFDKFYSQEIFQFKNEELIEEFIENILFKFKQKNGRIIYDSISEIDTKKTIFFLREVLINFLFYKKINLRRLLTGIKFGFNYSNRDLHADGRFERSIDLGILILTSLFSGLEDSFIDTLKKGDLFDNYEDRSDFNMRDNNYDKYSLVLLKRMNLYNELDIFEENNEERKKIDLDYKGLSYNVYLGDVGINKILNSLNGKEISSKKFFYAVLIRYVEEKFYLKRD